MDGWSDKHSLTNMSSCRERERERERQRERARERRHEAFKANKYQKKKFFFGVQQGQSPIKNQCSGDMLCFHDRHQHEE